MTAPRPLRGAALTTARNTRPQTPTGPDSDHRDRVGTTVPETVRDLLHTPGVQIRPDEMRRCVVIELPVDLAEDLIPYSPDPLHAALACQLIADPEDHRL